MATRFLQAFLPVVDMENIHWMDPFRTRLGRKFQTFHIATELFSKSHSKTIVETGTIRSKDDWGAGYSTFLFAWYVHLFGGILISVDNNAASIRFARTVTDKFSTNVRYVIKDSVKFLTGFTNPIGLLYLDSLDSGNKEQSENASRHQLKEIEAAISKIDRNGVVLLDDAFMDGGGKSIYSRKFLESCGWREVMIDMQSVWTRQ